MGKMMEMNWKYRSTLALVLLLFLSLTAGCFMPEAAIAEDQTGDLIISLGDDEVISSYLADGGSNAVMSVFQIASSDRNGGWNIHSGFADFGIADAEKKLRSGDDSGVQKILENAAFREKALSTSPIQTVSINGEEFRFSSLPSGIYYYYAKIGKGSNVLVVHGLVPIPYVYRGVALNPVKVTSKKLEYCEFPLTAVKYMEGRDFYEGDEEEFTFIVEGRQVENGKKVGNAPMPERNNVRITRVAGESREATVDFGRILFTHEHAGKTFEYTIREEVAPDSHVTPTPSSRTVTVKVEEIEGMLTVTKIADSSDDLVFTNTFSTVVSIPLNANKELVNRDFIEGDSWTFNVTPRESDAPRLRNIDDTKPADPLTIRPTSGNLEEMILGYLFFDESYIGKTFHYTIAESGQVDDVTNDRSKHVTVQVKYNPETHNIEVESTSDDPETVTFRNVYEASITFEGTKELIGVELLGRKLLEGEFAFDVMEDGKIIQTVYNDAYGNIIFKPITYTVEDAGENVGERKIHTYTVKERKIEGGLISTDTREYTIKIGVTNEGNGMLKVEPIEGIEFDDPFQLSFTNKVNTDDLQIMKSFKETRILTAAEKPEFFPVTVKLTTEKGKPYSGTFEMIEGKNVKSVTFDENGEAHVEVKYIGQNPWLTIKGIPVGIRYEVTEEMTDDQKERYGSPEIYNATGIIGQSDDPASLVAITNTRKTSDLTISKVMITDYAEIDADKEFIFNITLSDENLEPFECKLTYYDADGKQLKEEKVQFVGGKATVKVKGNQNVKISGLPVGIGYTIGEEKMPFFKLTGKTGDTGTITAEGSTATFTNERVVKPVSLTVSKTVQNNENDTTNFTFTVTLSDTTINGKYGDMIFENGVATFTLKSGESATATGLSSGISYKVEEADSTNYYIVEATGVSGTINADAELGPDREAHFVNAKTPATNPPPNPPGPGPVTTPTPEPEEPTPTPTVTPAPDIEYTSVEVWKTWDDNNDAAGKRPDSIIIHLFADSAAAMQEVASATITAADGWHWTFTNLPVLDNYNLPIDYSIVEEAVPGYTTTINGFNVTNSMKTELTSATVVKKWEDDPDNHPMRPTTLRVTLYNDGTPIMTVTLNEGNGWRATVNDLPVYQNGRPITYNWVEEEVLGYTQTANSTDGTVTTITNTLWNRLPPPDGPIPPGPQPGNPEDEIDDYGTPLGLGIIINHVGDCFD